MDLLIEGSHGQYIPQVFAEQYPELIEDKEDLDILLDGPEHDDYWETWDYVFTRYGSDGEFLTYGEGGGDLFLCSPSPLDDLIHSMADGEDCPDELREMIIKICNEFITGLSDEFVSEDEAVQQFRPSVYNEPEVNIAMLWINKQLKATL
jgi:hypothetical protein